MQFLILMIAATAAAYARFAIGPLQETMRAALSLSDNQMALLQGPAMALPMVVIAVPLGLLIDRYSRVKLLLLFAVLDLLGSVATALTSRFLVLFLARCLTGLGVAAVNTIAFALLADLYDAAHRGRATMMVVIGQYAGMSAAFAWGGALVAKWALVPDGWRRVMLYLTLPLLPAAALVLMMREPSRAGGASGHSARRIAWIELWRARTAVLPAMVGLILAEMSVLAVLTWAAPTLSRNLGLEPDRVGAVMAMALMVSGILGPLIGGVLADLCERTGGTRWTMGGLALLSLLGVLGAQFPAARSEATAALALGIFMTSVGAVIVGGIALFTIVVPAQVRGLCVSVLAGAQVLFGVGTAPLIVSALSGALGGPSAIGRALLAVTTLTCLLAAAAFALGTRSLASRRPA